MGQTACKSRFASCKARCRANWPQSQRKMSPSIPHNTRVGTILADEPITIDTRTLVRAVAEH